MLKCEMREAWHGMHKLMPTLIRPKTTRGVVFAYVMIICQIWYTLPAQIVLFTYLLTYLSTQFIAEVSKTEIQVVNTK